MTFNKKVYIWDNWNKKEHLEFMKYANTCSQENLRKILRAWFNYKRCNDERKKQML